MVVREDGRGHSCGRGLLLGVRDRRAAAPLPAVRLGILRNRALSGANLYTVLIGAWSAGELLVARLLYLQLVLHYTPLHRPAWPWPLRGSSGSSVPHGGPHVRRVGLTPFLVVSGVSAASGLLLVGLVLGLQSYALLLVGFMLAGYGTATAAFGTTVAATQGVADGEQGLAGGLINMSRQVGAALGVAIAAAMIGTGATSGGAVGPDRAAVLVTATTAALAAALALRHIKRPSRTDASIQLESQVLDAKRVGGPSRRRTVASDAPHGRVGTTRRREASSVVWRSRVRQSHGGRAIIT